VSDDNLHEQPVAYGAVNPRSEFAALQAEIYRSRVLRARLESIEEKILAGQELFESACEITLAGIRHQNPGISEERVREILRDRLKLGRKLEAIE
jgi:hypothetical protein